MEEDEHEKEVVETDISKHEEGQADWEQINEKVEELNTRVARHFEDANDEN